MQHVHARGEVGEEQRLFYRGVATAHYRHFLAAKKETIASGARRNTVAAQARLRVQPQPARGSPGRNNQCFAAQHFAIVLEHQLKRMFLHIHARHVPGAKYCPEALCLLPEQCHQLRPLHAVWEARIVLHVRCNHQLPARLNPRHHHRRKVGTRRINCSG